MSNRRAKPFGLAESAIPAKTPGVSARMAATFDRFSDGRLLINIVTGGDPEEAKGDGVFLTHDERYEVTDEFLNVRKRVMADETVTFQGKHLLARAEAISAAIFRRLLSGRN